MVFGLTTPHHDSKIAGTFAQKLGWVFVGPCHPSAHVPPAKLRSFTSLQMVDTHTRPAAAGPFKAPTNEMTVKMEGKWK